MKKIVLAVTGFVVMAFAAMTLASAPVGVTPTLLARGTYDAFKLRTPPDSLVDLKLEAKNPLDVVVRIHDYLINSSTGWHTHPGPVLITVVQGEVTFYEYRRPDVHSDRGICRSGLCRHRTRAHRDQRERAARQGCDGDLRAGGHAVPWGAERTGALLCVLTARTARSIENGAPRSSLANDLS